MQEGWAGKKKKDRKSGEIITIGGLKNFLTNPWTVIDSLNYALYIWYIAVRVDILSTIYNKDKIIVVPTNRYARSPLWVQSQFLNLVSPKP